ncbi:hypothetical protein IE982_05670 [Enterobacter hormaechei]|nr:hypothetical protein [Enterobacter hormaechei]
MASSGCLPRHGPALCRAAYASWITTPTLNNPSATGRYHGTKPMATSSVVAGNRLTKLLITGCRISANTLCGNRTARVRNATLRRNQIATASATEDLARPARHRPDGAGITPGEPHAYGPEDHTEIPGGQVKNALV